jgi:hypothetical protein
MNPIILTKSNLSDTNIGNNNIFTYSLNQNYDFSNQQLALGGLNVYYSWNNIETQYNNKKFSYTYPDGGATTTYNIELPDGNYNITDIQSYLEYICIQNNTYLKDDTGTNVFYLFMEVNAVSYRIQLNSRNVPTSLPAGWSNPGAIALPSAANENPQFIFASSSSFNSVVGFDTGTYPTLASGNVPYSVLGSVAPNLSPVSTGIVSCELIYNKVANSSTSFYSFSATNTPYGEQIEVKPAEFAWVDCIPASKNHFHVVLLDQEYNNLKLNDPDVTIILYLRDKPSN